MVTTTSLVYSAPNSSDTSAAVSKSMVSLAVTGKPMRKSFFTTSALVFFRRVASSLTTISSGMVM